MKRFLTSILLAVSCVAAGAATLSPIQLLNPAGSTAGQAVVSTGPSTPPVWGPPSAIGAIAANSVYGNFTGSSAAPIANAVPSCSTANGALKYTSGTGLSCGTTFALTSGNLSQFASTTSAQLLGVLSDETGTGVAVFSASPTFTGTVNTAALTATGAITPSQTAGIVGTTTNNNANAGAVGEYVSSSIAAGSAVALTTGVATNVTSISLTGGDWTCTASVYYQAGGATTVTQIIGAISQTSATLPTPPNGGGSFLLAPSTTGGSLGVPGLSTRVQLTGTTTIYLVAQATFSASTESAYGFIGCRRAR